MTEYKATYTLESGDAVEFVIESTSIHKATNEAIALFKAEHPAEKDYTFKIAAEPYTGPAGVPGLRAMMRLG